MLFKKDFVINLYSRHKPETVLCVLQDRENTAKKPFDVVYNDLRKNSLEAFIPRATCFVDQFDNENETNTYLTLFVELISRWTANKTYLSEQKDSSVTTRKDNKEERDFILNLNTHLR